MNETVDMEEFRITPEKLVELQKLQAKSPAPQKPKREIQFYKFTRAVVDALVQANNYGPAWALVAAILEARFEDYRTQNPVKLTSARLAKFRISKNQKLRGLKILQQSGLFLVEGSKGRNPKVTIK